ncbi:MAG: SH3 domain-containing protein [Patescibacteria group bacterium]
MIQKKILLRLSITLLVFNLVIGTITLFNSWRASQEIAKAALEKSKQSQVLGVNNIPKFNRNFVLSNDSFSSSRVFPTEASVQSYLEKTKSPLKSFVAEGKSASYWIFGAARGVTSSKYGITPNINPALIITFLEKEQSLISLKNYDTYKDPERRIKYAMGYGCPDGAACDAKYNGFVNQVNWAAYQLQFNYNNAPSGKYVRPYKLQDTITTLDEYNVFLSNQATAAIYRYTPHVYWGAYNTWKIMVGNGWGQNPNPISLSQIDQVNLVNKDANIELPASTNIDPNTISNLLKNGCRLGQTGENIKNLQRYLRQKGFFMSREITGMCGTVTKRALELYFGKEAQFIEKPAIMGGKTIFADSKGVKAKGLNTRVQPCGITAGSNPINWGTKGDIISGPTPKACLGGNWNWYKINWENGTTGWSVSAYLTDAPAATIKPAPAAPESAVQAPTFTTEPAPKIVTTNSRGVKVAGLNLRSGPCTNKIGVIPWSVKGKVLAGPIAKKCFGRDLEWLKVQFDNGKTGWVASYYLG